MAIAATVGSGQFLLKFVSVIFGVLLALVAGEIAARLLVYWRWEPERIRIYTEHSSVKGAYMEHAVLPYVPRPNFKRGPYVSHNSLGYKGKNFPRVKEVGKKRIVAIGGSTTYGQAVSPEDTHAGQLERLLIDSGEKVEVINAGVPGWISTDNLLNFEHRVVALRPDLIIIYQGRNEIFPQVYNNFREDYSHFRKLGFKMSRSNYWYKEVFSISHLLMLITTYRGDRFGWSSIEEDPTYSVIKFSNRPNDAEILQNLKNPNISKTYRNVLERFVAIGRENGIKILFATMAFRAEYIVTGLLKLPRKSASNNQHDPAVYDALQNQLEKNNQIVREVGLEYNIPVADTASLTAYPDVFSDDCHVNSEGHFRRAQILFDVIKDKMLLASNDSAIAGD